MYIDKKAVSPGENIYYDPSFRVTIEAHLEFLRASTKSNIVDIQQNKAAIYEGDLFGYLAEAGIDLKYHWIIMRVNKMTSPYMFGAHTETLIVPDQTQLEIIRSAHMSSGQITL